MNFVQDENGLTVTPNGVIKSLSNIENKSLEEGIRVLRIEHDKSWFNDDDPSVSVPGCTRICNLGTGDFNNDLTISETPGDVWSCTFSGNNISVIAPKEAAGELNFRLTKNLLPPLICQPPKNANHSRLYVN